MSSPETRHYYPGSGGRWICRTTPPQCNHLIMGCVECQGTAGHQGVHWAYRPCGSLWCDDNDADPGAIGRFFGDKIARDTSGSASMVPPGHADYRHPKDMQSLLYTAVWSESEVTDPELIARLDAGDPPNNASMITRDGWNSGSL